MAFLGSLSDPFKGWNRDLQLGDTKVTLNNLGNIIGDLLLESFICCKLSNVVNFGGIQGFGLPKACKSGNIVQF